MSLSGGLTRKIPTRHDY